MPQWLMAIVGKDENNQMIAYVVVEVEKRDLWQWVLDLILQDLNNLMQRSCGFVLDQQKVTLKHIYVC